MNAFLTKMQDLLQKIKHNFGDHRCSLAAAVLLSVLSVPVEMIDSYYYRQAFLDPDSILWHLSFDVYIVIRFLLFFCIAALFTETCFQGRKLQTLLGMILSAVFAGAGAFFISLNDEEQVFGVSGRVLNGRAQELVGGCVLLLLILTVYFSFRKTKLRFEEYMVRIIVNFFMVFSVYIVLLIGVMLICSIIIMLFGDWDYLAMGSMAFVSGMVLIPGGILALKADSGLGLTGTSERDQKMFLQVFIQYVLCILTICALLAVYLYVFRILIVRELPSNEIFPILAGLFCIGMPIWLMAGCWKRETLYFRVLSALPYAFAPLIVMQILAAGMRIRENGLTPTRYVAVILIIFEIGTIVIWHFCRKKLEWILLLMSGLVVLTFLVPGVNRYRLSVIWQQAWLQKYYENVQNDVQLSPLEYQRLKGAYDYLEDMAPDNRMVETYNIYQEDFAVHLSGMDPKKLELTEYKRYSIHGCQLVGMLDVAEFKTMNMLNKGDFSLKDEEPVDFSVFPFEIRETGEEIIVDISEFAQKCMEYIEEHPDASEEEQRAYMQGFNRIVMDQDRILYINHFQVSYQKGMKEGKDYFEWKSIGQIGGMLIQK